MPQTYSQLHFHFVFSTKGREPTIETSWRERLWQYLGGITKDEGGIPIQIGGTADHVHLLVTLFPKIHLPEFMKKLKANSSGWVHRTFPESRMWWQIGYGAFSVSHSALGVVKNYIIDQESHHRTMTFQEEYRLLLERHGIQYDEKYLWD